MRFSEFDFDLPEALIAQVPLAVRSASRLLDCTARPLADRLFTDLPGLLRAGDLLVFNDTKVIKARLRGSKSSGGRIEVLIERIIATDTAIVQARASHAPLPGGILHFGSGNDATVLAREGAFYTLRFSRPVIEVLDAVGELPLPPYIRHAPGARDDERYQTVLARPEGAVAAPTAGLHFDHPLLETLRSRGVGIATLTLHVGAGTFQPPRTDDLDGHQMHAERYFIPDELPAMVRSVRAEGGRIVAVGTTSMRALESASDGLGMLCAGEGETRLFITPGYEFRVVDLLITNFHLPRSTLLVLVSAFAGVDAIRHAYAHAIGERYRFFSYGDAMLLERS